jgi:predicted nucleic acid-binding protein
MNTPTPLRGLIDTPILADYRAGEPNAVAFIGAVRLQRLPEFSQLSALVLLANAPNLADFNAVSMFLTISTVHNVTARIALRAQDILESLTPPSGLTADDALIAATAIEHSLPLYTLDPNRFAAVPKLTAARPY